MAKLKVFLTSVLFVAFFMSGCGSDNSDSPASTSSTVSGVDVTDNTNGDETDNTIVVTDQESITISFKNTSSTVLTTNSQVVTIDVQVFDNDNAPYSDGSIKVIYPNKAVTGTDVGQFDVAEKAISNGKATFTYTAPENLQDRVDAGDTGSTFGFYHTADKNNTLQVYTFTYAPVANQVTLTDYELKNSYSLENPIIGLEDSIQLSFYVQDKKGNKLVDADVTSIDVELVNPALANLKDTVGNEGSSLSFTTKNDVSVSLESNTLSGIVPIRVTSVFVDANGDSRTLTSTFSVIILSGPPTAMSLSYVSTENAKDRSKFIETWALSVTDKYNNPVNTNPIVSMGMIAGFATSSVANANPNDELYYEPTALSGQLVQNGTSDQFTTLTAAGIFNNVDFDNDVLATFGEGYTFDASGKWDIEALNSSTLTLKDNFEGSTTSNLAFAVGHNFRDEQCRFGKKAVGIVYPKDNIYAVDTTGSMLIQVEYDYYMTGKNVVLWANLVGNQNSNTSDTETTRLGHAQKENLRGMGIDDIAYNFAEGQTGTYRFILSITDTVEWYRNANFGWNIFEISGEGNVGVISGTSMDNGVESCAAAEGKAYIDVTITTAAKDGTITISEILPTDEF
jgi:hypothetical protein